jgi:hypothetical protein
MKTKTVKITLEGFGSYLGMEKGCFIVKDREGNGFEVEGFDVACFRHE